MTDPVRMEPCPFCGGEQVRMTNARMSNHTFYVGCYNECCWRPRTDGYDNPVHAADAWNRRASPPARDTQPDDARDEHAAALAVALRGVLEACDVTEESIDEFGDSASEYAFEMAFATLKAYDAAIAPATPREGE